MDLTQSGFRPNHNTESAIVCVQDVILRQVDDGAVVALVLLDLSAAFNTIDHGVMWQHFQSVAKLGGSALEWMVSSMGL